MKYLKQVEMHPKFMLFWMFIKRIQLKMQSESFIKERCIDKSNKIFDPLKRIDNETFSKLNVLNINAKTNILNWLQIQIFSPN